MSDVVFETSEVRCTISYIYYITSDVKFGISDV